MSYEWREYALEKDQVFWIDCYTFHHYECHADDKWEIVWVHFYGANASAYYQVYNTSKNVVTEAVTPADYVNRLMRIVGLCKHRHRNSELIISGLITDLLTEMIVESNDTVNDLPMMPDFIRTTISYIDKHFSEPISLDKMAAASGVSKFYLSREFKRHLGETPFDYLISVRLNYAKELLLYSTEPISQVAEKCGIPHTTHFINLFKRQEGMTPASYRKSWRL